MNRPYYRALFAIAITVAAGYVDDVQAREAQHRSGTFNNSRGNSGSFHQQVERGNGKTQRETEWQGQHGNGNTKSTRSVDRDSGTVNGKRSTHLSGGKSASSTWQSTRSGEGSRNVTATREGFNGHSSTYAGTQQRNGNGSVSGNGTITRDDGRTADVASSHTKTDDGWNSSGTLTTDNGAQYGREATVAASDGSATRTVTVTGPNGESHTHSGTATLDR